MSWRKGVSIPRKMHILPSDPAHWRTGSRHANSPCRQPPGQPRPPVRVVGQPPGHPRPPIRKAVVARCTHCTCPPCTALHVVAPHCTSLHCIARRCTALHVVALHCTSLHCIARRCTALHVVALHCTSLHCIARRCTALHVVAPHCTQRGATMQRRAKHQRAVCQIARFAIRLAKYSLRSRPYATRFCDWPPSTLPRAPSLRE